MRIEKIRKTGTMILAGAFGMVVIQLAAPMILGILVQGAALAVPLAVYHVFVKEKWRIKLVRGNGETCGERQAESEAPYESDPGFLNGNPFDGEGTPFDRVKETEPEIPETESEHEKRSQDMEKGGHTAAWYEEEGKDKIMAVAMKLMKKDVGEFWIRKDGICNFHTGKGYRRAGIIPGFSKADRETLVQLLGDEGFMVQDQGKYLYLTWVL